MQLEQFWRETKTKQNSSKISKQVIISTLVVLLIGIGVSLRMQRNKQETTPPNDLPSVLSNQMQLPEANSQQNFAKIQPAQKLTNNNATSLKVISANLIGIYEKNPTQSPAPTFNNAHKATTAGEATNSATKQATNINPPPQTSQLAGIRILGEVQNNGTAVINAALVIVRFFKNKKLVAKKIGVWNQAYKFIPLLPKEINVYDVLVPSPPKSDSVTIEMQPQQSANGQISRQLKIKGKQFTPLTTNQHNQKLTYYRLSGSLINISDADVVEPGVYFWLKNNQGKVIGLTTKFYPADILSTHQEIEINLAVFPLTTDKPFDYEVRTFARKLNL